MTEHNMESAADKARQSTGNRSLPLSGDPAVRDNKSGPEPVRQHDSGPNPHHSNSPRSEMPTSMPPYPPEAYTKPAERHGTWADYNAGCRCDECRNAARLYQKRRVYEGRPRRVSSLGVTRRIQALACLGWDMYAIAREVGTGRETVRQWTLHATVYRSTHERMDEVYERLSMRLPPERTKHERANVARARNRARREGWAPPLAWDDIDNDPAPAVVKCSIDECDRRPSRRGWCEMHYKRWSRCGDPEGTGKTGRPRGEATYAAVHRRLRNDRGRAREHICPCGSPAATWSYDHSDPDDLVDDKERPFSADLSRYQALCIPCHNRRDKAAARSRRDVDPVVVERRLSGDKRVPVTKAERVEIVRRGKAAGLSLRELEERCGINKPERYIEREEAA